MSDDVTAEALAEAEAALAEIEAQPWPRIVKLAHPVDFGSESVTVLEFRRGRMGDLKGVKMDGVPAMEQLMLIASRMCNRPLRVIELLDSDDTTEVLTIVLSFFRKCLPGGRRRSS
jgi:hypothetical protein